MLESYKPNKAGKGCLINFKLSVGRPEKGPYKEGCVFFEMKKQTGWNEQKGIGSFKGGDSVTVKLNSIEIGKMLNTLEHNRKFEGYHDGQNQIVHIYFTPWLDKASGEQKGFGLQVIREKNGEKVPFGIGFAFGEDQKLKRFLIIALEHILLGNYAEDKRMAKSFIKGPVNELVEEKEKEKETLEPEQNTELIDSFEAIFG